jgi:hypothetical protein
MKESSFSSESDSSFMFMKSLLLRFLTTGRECIHESRLLKYH